MSMMYVRFSLQRKLWKFYLAICVNGFLQNSFPGMSISKIVFDSYLS